jgi:hypothetical protein
MEPACRCSGGPVCPRQSSLAVESVAVAREIHEREDLLRDARALVPRVKMRVTIAGREQEVFAGFRGEALSLYFGDDPVYHFNSHGELRRAFVDNQLIKAEGARLVILKRKQSPTESLLERQAHDASAEQGLISRMTASLADLARAFADDAVEIVAEEPIDGDGVQRLVAWLNAHRAPPIAASPNVG